MANETVGRAIWEAALDRTGLKRDLAASEQDIAKSGTASEKAAADAATRSVSKIGSMTKASLQVVAVGAGVVFAAMSKGAMEMERAQGDFQAATGRSREEAVAFSKDMNGLVGSAGAVGKSFAEISKAGTQVAVQFGLTGAAGKAMTESFLEFAKVTKQDATAAVDAFDKTLDAFGEPAERAVGLMDQLVASHQKYGTDAGPAALAALAGMAPALKALNAGLDDGVGLLNLFEAAGLDASAGQAALNAAVKNMPAGTNLDDLIARLGKIENPADRAKAAIEIFGKQGTALANAIQPGTTGLADFEISITDAADATEKAADDMLTTTDRIQQGFEKFQGVLRGVGAEFGPLVTGIASFASLAGPLMAKAWTTLGAESAVGARAAGTLAGVSFGSAFQLAMIIGLPLAAKMAIDQVSGPVSEWLESLVGGSWFKRQHELNGQAGAKDGQAYAMSWAAAVEQAKGARGDTTGRSMFDPQDTVDAYQETTAAAWANSVAASEAWKAQQAFIDENTNHVGHNASAVQGSLNQWFAYRKELDAGKAATRAARAAVIGNFAGMAGSLHSLLGPNGSMVKDAEAGMDDLRWAVAHPNAWAKTRKQLEKDMREAQRILAKAIRDGKPEVIGAAQGTIAGIQAQLDKLPPRARAAGTKAGNLFAAGLDASGTTVAKSAQYLTDLVGQHLYQTSPAKKGALSKAGGSFGWGVIGAKLYAKGWDTGLSAWGGPKVPGFENGYRTLAVGATSTVRHEHSVARLELLVRDPDGGLARAGITVEELSVRLEKSVRMASVEHARAMDY